MLKINSGTVSEHAKTLITYIKSQGDETIQNVVPLFKKLAMGIICGMTINTIFCNTYYNHFDKSLLYGLPYLISKNIVTLTMFL